MQKNINFFNEEEKMKALYTMSKDDFLSEYQDITEESYNNTVGMCLSLVELAKENIKCCMYSFVGFDVHDTLMDTRTNIEYLVCGTSPKETSLIPYLLVNHDNENYELSDVLEIENDELLFFKYCDKRRKVQK